MRTIFPLVLVILLVSCSVCSAQHPPTPEEALQGLLTGDKLRDRALGEALRRGYQRGYEDARQQCRAEVAKAAAECKKQR